MTVVPRLIALLAVLREMGRGPSLQGKITVSALDKFCHRGWKANKIEILHGNKKYEMGEGQGVRV